MIDLHSHILPGIDDGAPDMETAVAMALASVADGVTTMACTPHIMAGVYNNTGESIRAAVNKLQHNIDQLGIKLQLVVGSDAHVAPDLIARLRSGRTLALADSRYVLVEPPHNIAPVGLEELFFQLLLAGYVPILTHPERLKWISTQYATIVRLKEKGAWMQITAGSLAGSFGRDALYWSQRMLDEGHVHILATDAHNLDRRPPNLSEGRAKAAERVGEAEATDLVVTRPQGIVDNIDPAYLPSPLSGYKVAHDQNSAETRRSTGSRPEGNTAIGVGLAVRGLFGRMQRFLERS